MIRAIALAALLLPVPDLIRDLGSDSYEKREEAQDALLLAGPEADSALDLATHASDLEVAERARLLLLRRHPITQDELLEHAQDLQGRQVTLVGLVQAVQDGFILARISPDPREEARPGLPLDPGSREVRGRLLALDWMEVLATGALGGDGAFTVQDLRPFRAGFDPALPRLTAKALREGLPERVDAEVVAVGKVVRGSALHSAAIGGFGLETEGCAPVDLSGRLSGEDLGAWVGKTVEVRGFLRTVEDPVTKGKQPTLRMRDLRSAP